MKKNILTTGGIILALLLGVFGVVNDDKIIIQDGKPVSVGALTGPDIPYTYLNVAGARVEYRSGVWANGTTTPCIIEGPTASSSLIKFAAAAVRTDAAGDTTIDIGYNTTRYATSSTAAKLLFSATAWASNSAVEFASAGTSTAVIAPNQFIVFKLATSSLSTNIASSGTCSAAFLVN